MNSRILIIGLVAGAAVVAVAIVAYFVLSSSGGTVEVLETQNGETVQIGLDDKLVVVLAGNPTTGYNWTTTSIDDAVLRQVGDSRFDAESDLLGSPGTISLLYAPVAAGTSPLVIEYGPVAGGDSENTFSITVKVE